MTSDGNHETGNSNAGGGYRALKACVNFRAGGVIPSCRARDADALIAAVEEAMADQGLTLKLERVHCMGRCHLGPALRLVPAGPYFLGLSPQEGKRLVRMLAEGQVEEARRAFPEPEDGA